MATKTQQTKEVESTVEEVQKTKADEKPAEESKEKVENGDDGVENGNDKVETNESTEEKSNDAEENEADKCSVKRKSTGGGDATDNKAADGATPEKKAKLDEPAEAESKEKAEVAA